MSILGDYFFPHPPHSISKDSEVAMQADLQEKGFWSLFLNDTHRARVDAWTRHADQLARAENRIWLHQHGHKFIYRWGVVTILAWATAFLASSVWIQIPSALIGHTAGCLTLLMYYLRTTTE